MSCLIDLFGLKSFHGFVSLAQLENVTDCLSSLLFCIIVLFIVVGSSKSTQKTSICSKKNTQIELNNITQIFRRKNINFLPTLTQFFKDDDKVFKKLARGRNFLRKSWGKPKWDGVFSFPFPHY